MVVFQPQADPPLAEAHQSSLNNMVVFQPQADPPLAEAHQSSLNNMVVLAQLVRAQLCES